MENLFDIPPRRQSDNRCGECKHIANINPYGVKAVKRMSKACNKFKKK